MFLETVSIILWNTLVRADRPHFQFSKDSHYSSKYGDTINQMQTQDDMIPMWKIEEIERKKTEQAAS